MAVAMSRYGQAGPAMGSQVQQSPTRPARSSHGQPGPEKSSHGQSAMATHPSRFCNIQPGPAMAIDWPYETIKGRSQISNRSSMASAAQPGPTKSASLISHGQLATYSHTCFIQPWPWPYPAMSSQAQQWAPDPGMKRSSQVQPDPTMSSQAYHGQVQPGPVSNGQAVKSFNIHGHYGYPYLAHFWLVSSHWLDIAGPGWMGGHC